jgi:hypothetical protein
VILDGEIAADDGATASGVLERVRETAIAKGTPIGTVDR